VLVPFKGFILNLFTRWGFETTKDIVPNALIDIKSLHPLVFLYEKVDSVIPFEFIVRGYVWGSIAGDLEDGNNENPHLALLPKNATRYQKLEKPIFTPTIKAEIGDDTPVTFEQMCDELGEEVANRLREISIRLYERGAKLAEERGLILVDTKYEFGMLDGNIVLIDEVNTPDSSRYVPKEEYDAKFPQIAAKFDKDSSCKNVTELLEKIPELKITELSKQFVRDLVLESGYDPKSSDAPPTLSEEQIIETSKRYLDLYAQLIGREFEVPAEYLDGTDLEKSITKNLIQLGFIKGGCVIIISGSDSDKKHVEEIKSEIQKYGIPVKTRIVSAHKQPEKCELVIREYNKSTERLVIISVAGKTDALSGTISFPSNSPVVSCPPDQENIQSCLSNPPGSSNAVIPLPKNVAKFVAQVFSFSMPFTKKILEEDRQKKIDKLEASDSERE
jgi:phosphoribosylaminoimidazole-succinocarboxamide synthase